MLMDVGHINLIGGLVTCNPLKKQPCVQQNQGNCEVGSCEVKSWGISKIHSTPQDFKVHDSVSLDEALLCYLQVATLKFCIHTSKIIIVNILRVMFQLCRISFLFILELHYLQ